MGTKLILAFLVKLDLTLVHWRGKINKKIEKLKEEQRTEE